MQLGLTKEQKAKRRFSLGGSDANIIMGGDNSKLIRLWEEKTGARDSEDLSNSLPVQLGSYTEAFNVFWFEKNTGMKVDREDLECIHADNKWMTCTLDGHINGAVFEAKHVGAFRDIEDVVQGYMPQLHHNMHVIGADKAYLSVIRGTTEWDYFEVELDPFYLDDLIKAETHFWDCVKTNTPPVTIDAITPNMPDRFKKIDMTGNNEWGDLAALWVEEDPFIKRRKSTQSAINKMIGDDVSFISGHGIQVKIAKNGRKAISEHK